MSVNILDLVKQSVPQPILDKIADMLGIDRATMDSVFNGAVGALLNGLINKSESAEGLGKILKSADQQDDSILGNLDQVFENGPGDDAQKGTGGELVESIFGIDASKVAAISKGLGLDSSQLTKLLGMIAPVVLAVIGKFKSEQSLDAEGVKGLLADQKQYLASANSADTAPPSKPAAPKSKKRISLRTKILFALLVLVSIAYGVYELFIRNMNVAAKINYVPHPDDLANPMASMRPTGAGGGNRGPRVPHVKTVDISSLGESGRTLKQDFDKILSSMAELETQADAQELIGKIDECSNHFDELDFDRFSSGLSKAAARAFISGFFEKADEQISQIKDNEIKKEVKNALDGLGKKMSAFTSKAVVIEN